MARVTTTEVNAIFAVETLSDLDTFITTANLVVTDELSSAGLSTNRLKQIELYLSAHYAAVTFEKGGLRKQKIGEAEEDYKVIGSGIIGLSSTRYGQQAITLDPTGTLGALSASSVKAKFRIV